MIIIGDVFIRLVDLPCRVRGYTCKDASGNYNVIINSKLSTETQKEACLHELSHIYENHFDDYNVDEIEGGNRDGKRNQKRK